MKGVAARTQASEERLRQGMDGGRRLRQAFGLGPEYSEYFDALHEDCMATACTSDWEFAQRLVAAGYSDADAAARVAADVRTREARLDALWEQAASRERQRRSVRADDGRL